MQKDHDFSESIREKGKITNEGDVFDWKWKTFTSVLSVHDKKSKIISMRWVFKPEPPISHNMSELLVKINKETYTTIDYKILPNMTDMERKIPHIEESE